MSEFHWLRPTWLLGLPMIVAFALLMIRRPARSEVWNRMIDPWLMPYVLSGAASRNGHFGLGLTIAGGTLAILALAGPTWDRVPTPAFRSQAALVLALDLSRSMDSQDLKPSRLEKARFKLTDILQRRGDGSTALIVFGGDAFTVTPLTADVETIHSQLGALSTAIVPLQGSSVSQALALAERLLRQGGATEGDVLLLTDAADEGARDAAARLAQHGYRVSVLGIGTADGAPIPSDGGFLRDASGNLVVPRLDTAALARVALAGSGIYRTISVDSSDVDALQTHFEKHSRQAVEATAGLTLERWNDRGPWLVVALLPLAALGFRRGWLLTGVLAVSLQSFAPTAAYAASWDDWWRRPDQRGAEAFDKGQFEAAAGQFSNPDWKAAALYRDGKFEEAATALKDAESAEALYNRGNALARGGHLKEALEAYASALQKDPNHSDAQYNKEIVEKELQRQHSNSEQQQQQGDSMAQSGTSGSESKPPESPNNPANNPESPTPKPNPPNESSTAANEASHSDGRENPAQKPEPERESDTAKEAEPKSPAAQDTAKKESESVYSADSKPEEAPTESQQADEQWLRRIPDDPSGLLRRKFAYQLQQRARQGQNDQAREPAW